MAQKTRFFDLFDCIYAVNKPIREDKGEDSLYCANSAGSAIACVCDGCGGLGARTYNAFQGHTGAYIASRAVSGSIKNWYHKHAGQCWESAEAMAESLQRYINKGFDRCDSYLADHLRIRGSMVRKLPSTLALAYAQPDEAGIVLHIVWAGDSRVYLMDESGLAQLTLDDTEVTDAMENLTSDAPMTNVLSADKNYHLNSKTIRITRPTLVFAATDGCFGYIPSPMEFEYLVIKAIAESKSPDEMKKALYDLFAQYAGDDFSFGMMSFMMGDFRKSTEFLKPRLKELTENYMDPIMAGQDKAAAQKLWQQYKPAYERYLGKRRAEQ